MEGVHQADEGAFPKIVNIKFTAQMEKDLDIIEEGKSDWVQTLHDFYGDFDKTLKEAKEAMQGVKLELEEDKTDIICEKCGPSDGGQNGPVRQVHRLSGLSNARTSRRLFRKRAPPALSAARGKVIVKKTKKGRVFYGCSEYPNCDFVSWDEPTNELCPQCGKPLLKRRAKSRSFIVQPRAAATKRAWKMNNRVLVAGAGLAGCEAAYQIASAACTSRCMKESPPLFSPAHHSPDFAELVCSNSLKADRLESAAGLF